MVVLLNSIFISIEVELSLKEGYERTVPEQLTQYVFAVLFTFAPWRQVVLGTASHSPFELEMMRKRLIWCC